MKAWEVDARDIKMNRFGAYVVPMWNKEGWYLKEHCFMYYPKREVIALLRTKYGCVVRHAHDVAR